MSSSSSSTIRKPCIVITGAGMITNLGDDPDTIWRRAAACEPGFGPMPDLECALPDGHSGAQAVDLPADFEPELPRESRYLRWAILHALRSASINPATLPYPPHRCGIILGTTLHGMRAGGRFLRTGDYGMLKDFLASSVLQRAIAGLPIAGDAMTTCSACSSSLGSIALAVTLIDTGELDLVISGGYDATSEYAYAGFNSLRLVTQGPLRPFAKDRTGMKLGEGYGIVILERSDAAKQRGTRAFASVLGWGESADSHHLTQPHPQGSGAAQAIRDALKRSKLNEADIDLVAAHATGTPDNDTGESAALRQVFSEHLGRLPVVGFKSHLGHTLGGAGANELILSALAMRDQMIPGCAGLKADEIEFTDLSVSIGCAKPGRIRATLNTSLGFGGANTAAILGTDDREGQAAEVSRRPVYITGMGIVLPGAIGTEAFAALMRSGSACTSDTGAIPEDQYIHLLNARRVRRMSEYVKLSLAATALACTDAGITLPIADGETWSAVLGSNHGSAQYCYEYYKQVVEQGLSAANPMLFAEGVPNAAAAHLSLMLSLKGACQTVIGSRTAGLDALRLATLRIASGEWDRAIVGAAEEYNTVINNAYKHCGLYAGQRAETAQTGFATGAGAVTFILESEQSIEQRGGRRRAMVKATSAGLMETSTPTKTLEAALGRIGMPATVVTSANGTWIDRTEEAAIRRSCEAAHIVAPPACLPELFSVTALASIAAGIMSQTADFGVLCTGYSGNVAAARVQCGSY